MLWPSLSKKEKAMRSIFYLPALFGILFFAACKPSRHHSSGPFTGKVIGSICSQYTIQLIAGDMDPARYLKTWKNVQNDSTYHNVFAVGNYCDFGKQGLQKGDTFHFRLLRDSAVQSCVICLIYEPTPDVHNTIQVVQTVK
jgi:hypothetical protein